MTDDQTRDELAQLRADFTAQLAAQEARFAARLARSHRPRHRLPRRFLPLALVALLVVLTPFATFAANPFTDLVAGSPHNGNIDAIYNAGITTGCVPNAKYCPTDNVTRQEMASFLARTAGLGGNAPIANAKTAQTATNATNAVNANNAANAVNAGHATNADTATNATTASNANTVGGYAPNGLVRVARGVGQVFPATVNLTTAYQTVASVTIQIPAGGFVLVSGATGVSDFTASGNEVDARLRDTGTGGQASPYI